MSPRHAMLVGIAMLFGCGVDESESTPTPGECKAPNRVVGDACLEPGVQDDGCLAGTLGTGDGRCQPAGIAAEMCGEGFVHDGDVGCEPILPAEPCPFGLMAVPGERACRAVMPCGTGTWGDIPTEPTTEYVDASYSGGDADGSAQKPWTSIAQALTAAAPGAMVAIAEGSYQENLTIAFKAVRLWGVCPSKVAIAGTAALDATLVISAASGTEIHGVAIGGAGLGLAETTSDSVLLDRVWLHDTAERGLNARRSVHVVDSLVEKTRDAGLVFGGAQGIVERSVIRDVLPRSSDQGYGVGVSVQLPCIGGNCDAGQRANVTLQGSLIERNHKHGLFIFGSDAIVEGSIVRGTLPSAADQTDGDGISVEACPLNAGCDRLALGKATVRASLVEQNRAVGIMSAGADVLVESTVVRGNLPASDQRGGDGMVFQVFCYQAGCDSTARTSATVRSSLVEQNNSMGLMVAGADAIVEATVVRNNLPQALDQELGGGIYVQRCDTWHGCATPAPTSVTLRGSVIDQIYDVGLFVGGADAVLEATLVRDVVPRAADGLFGDAIEVFSMFAPARASLTNCRLERSARAGVGNFGGIVSLAATAVTCAAFPLNGEPFEGVDFTFEDRGANGCGCPMPDGQCQAQSAGLAPPPPLEP